MNVSFYNNIKSVRPKTLNLFKVLEDIQNGAYKESIKNVRLLINDKVLKDLEKKKLPLIGFSGTFSSRGNSNLLQSSGIAALDFDNVNDLETLVESVNKDKFTFSSFISPSGNGLKVLVKIPLVPTDADYKSFYSELQKHYDQYEKTDDSTKDISRASFVSYDPNLYLNLDSEMFTDRFIPNIITPTKVNVKLDDMDEVAQKLIVWFNKKWTTGDNRNNNLFMLSSAFNDYGVDKSTAIGYCMSYISNDFGEREINMLVNSAYKNTANFGTKSFEDKSKINAIKKMVFVGATSEQIKSKLGGGDELDAEINKIKSDAEDDIFWDIDDKGKIHISFYRFDRYLKNKGISKYFQESEGGSYEFITKDDNFINWIDSNRIKDIVKIDLVSQGHIDVWDVMARNTSYFSREYLSMLDTTSVKYKRDTRNESFLYYKNYAVRTTKDTIDLLEYNEIDDLIWGNQVIDRDIEINDESEGVFKTFIWRLSGEDKDRYFTLKSVIGYLLHSYQNDSKPKAIIFNDEMVSDDVPNGGSGKGLIHKAIGHIKNIVVEDGKRFDPKGQFAYQKVNKDTQIFLMDDVSRNFSFESLFSIVTEGMTVEKKGKDAFTIPFIESPKLSITTNYTVKGEGASFLRRVFEVEVANHFNDRHTPEDEFNHQFFSEWDEDEWQKFDNYMIRCIQYYLKNGLVESNKVNLAFRKLKNNVGNEFMEFMEAQNLTDLTISKKEFRDDFNAQYKNISRYNTAQKFNKKVIEYCDYYDIDLEESKYNGVRSFVISKQRSEGDVKEEEIGLDF